MRYSISIIVFTLFLSINLNAQSRVEKRYEVSLQALEFLKAKDADGFRSLIDERAIKATKEETFEKFIEASSKILQQYDYPERRVVNTERSRFYYKGRLIKAFGFIFPFPPPDQPVIISDYQIVFLFSNSFKKDKIISFKFRDFTQSRRDDMK